MNKLTKLFYDALIFNVDQSVSEEEVKKLAGKCAKVCEEEIRKAWYDGVDCGEARLNEREYKNMLENHLEHNYGKL